MNSIFKFLESMKACLHEFDLLVANWCFSQLTSEYRQEIFDCVMPNCKRCFIVDDAVGDFGRWIEDEVFANFDKVKMYPASSPLGELMIYMGER